MAPMPLWKATLIVVLPVVALFTAVTVADRVERGDRPRPGEVCNAIQSRFETAIHYRGRDHVVTTVNGSVSDEYYTRGYSGPENAAERATMNESITAWHTAGCKGPINQNPEFWHD